MDAPAVSYIAKLPTEILDSIIRDVHCGSLRPLKNSSIGRSHVPIHDERKRDLHSCSQVSKLWRDLTIPYLFRDIVFSACSTRPCEDFGRDGDVTAKSTPQSLPQCTTFAEFYNLFRALPVLRSYVRTLTLNVLPGQIHRASHEPAREVISDPYVGSMMMSFDRADEFTVKPTPQQLFDIIALFPNLRHLMLNDTLLDLSRVNRPSEPYQRRLELLSICFPRRGVLNRDPSAPVGDPLQEQSVKYLLQCFGEIGTLHFQGYDPHVSSWYSRSIDEQYPWRMHPENSRYRIPLQISGLIIEESNIPYTVFNDNIFVSLSIYSLRHLDMGAGPCSGGTLQVILGTIGRQLESLSFSALEFLSPHSLNSTGSFDLRSCTNLHSLLIRLDSSDVTHRAWLWEGLSLTLSTLPRFTSPSQPSALTSVTLHAKLFEGAEEAEEIPYLNHTSLREQVTLVESLLFCLFISCDTSQPVSPVSTHGRVSVVRSSRERFAGSYEGFIAAMFPRLHHFKMLDIRDDLTLYG